MNTPTEDEQRTKDLEEIKHAREVTALFEHPKVQQLMTDLAKQYFGEFRRAATAELRQDAWAKTAVLQDLLDSLRAVPAIAKIPEAREAGRQAAEAARERTTRK